tara:strand:- start:1586 stop:1915 length:330 start_codon:yes stop_codon:yes gene_type:complete
MQGFLLYKDNAEAVKKMDDETAGKLFKAIYDYADTGKTPKGETLVGMLFEFFKADIDRGHERHKEISKIRAAAGKKGGQQKQANLAKASKRSEQEQKPNGKNKWRGKDI